MKVVAVMDGASGSIRNKKYRTRRYMSNSVMIQMKKFDTHGPFFQGKGGIWNFWDRKLDNFIDIYNDEANELILFGKSYGGKDISKAISRLQKRGSLYSSIKALFVDPHWICRCNKNLIVPQINRIINIYQRNKSVFKGAEVESLTKDIEQYQITRDDIDHFNIVKTQEVMDAIKRILAS